MASLSKTVGKSTSEQPLRAFNPQRDLAAVADLVETCFAETLDENGREYLQRMRAAASNVSWLPWGRLVAGLRGAPLSGYVWQEDGRVVGNASMIPYFSQGRWFYLIANVAVLPEYRRRGIARRLTERCIEHTRQRHMSSVWLHVRQENDVAYHLYRSLGFVSRACRTSWQHAMQEIPDIPTAGISIGQLCTRHWELQGSWLKNTYPAELTWHIPFQINTFRPDLWGGFIRFLRDEFILQWGAFCHGRLLAALSWQAMPGPANHFWLAAANPTDEDILSALLLHACHRLPTRRPVMLEFPAGQFEYAFHRAGFTAQQTLIWMQLELV